MKLGNNEASEKISGQVFATDGNVYVDYGETKVKMGIQTIIDMIENGGVGGTMLTEDTSTPDDSQTSNPFENIFEMIEGAENLVCEIATNKTTTKYHFSATIEGIETNAWIVTENNHFSALKVTGVMKNTEGKELLNVSLNLQGSNEKPKTPKFDDTKYTELNSDNIGQIVG